MRDFMDDQQPEIPDGYRELQFGEALLPGDLQLMPVVREGRETKEWCKITVVEQLTVRAQGQYCRKVG